MAMARQTVFLVGATGETGRSIASALAAQPESFASLEKAVVKSLQAKGIKFVPGDLADPQAEFEKLFAKQDVVISTVGPLEIPFDTKLADAAKAAGVKRFVPCAWMPVVPVGGHFFRDLKEKTYNHVKRIRLPYTIIDDGWWLQNAYPLLPSGRVDYAHVGAPTQYVGSGEARTAVIDLNRIGLYTARIIADPRTLNKYVLAYDDVASQKDIFDTMEHFSGEKIPKEHVSADEITKMAAAGRVEVDQLAADGKLSYETFPKMVGAIVSQYYNVIYVAAYNNPEYAKYLGYLTTKELYPDIEHKPYQDVLRETIEGKGYKVYADRDWFKKD